MDRVTGIRLTDPSGEEYRLYEYAYDREGNLAVVRDIREDLGEETIETRCFYDLSGRLVYYRNDRDEDYRFTYDLNDNVEKVDQGNRYRATALEYGYDRDNRAMNRGFSMVIGKGQMAANPTSWNDFPGKVCRTIMRFIISMMRMGTLRRSQTEKERSSTLTIPVTS